MTPGHQVGPQNASTGSTNGTPCARVAAVFSGSCTASATDRGLPQVDGSFETMHSASSGFAGGVGVSPSTTTPMPSCCSVRHIAAYPSAAVERSFGS